MGADILDGLERFANGGYGDWSTVASKAIARIQLDAAEIVRLRGEVEELKTRRAEDVSILDDIRDAIGGGPYDTIAKRIRQAIAPAEAKDHAPAMPSGVEDIDWPFTYIVPDSKHEYVPKHHAERKIRDALRAADNRDAAGACSCPSGDGSLRWPCPQHPPESTPAAVPAGEAVAVVDVSGYPSWLASYLTSPNWKSLPEGTKLYTHLPAAEAPAPVQAAPQEGEASAGQLAHRLTHSDTVKWMRDTFAAHGFGIPDGVIADAVRTARHNAEAAHPSACELGAVRELVKAWREQGNIEWKDKRCELTNVRGKTRHNCADELEAALQHRGDSQEVGRG